MTHCHNPNYQPGRVEVGAVELVFGKQFLEWLKQFVHSSGCISIEVLSPFPHYHLYIILSFVEVSKDICCSLGIYAQKGDHLDKVA